MKFLDNTTGSGAGPEYGPYPKPIKDALEDWESRTDDADMRRTLAGIRQDVAELMTA